MSMAYISLSESQQQLLVDYSRTLASTLSSDRVQAEKADMPTDIELITEPYYHFGKQIYYRTDSGYVAYSGKNTETLSKMIEIKHQLSASRTEKTFHWLSKIFALSVLCVLLISFLIYRFYTKKLRYNIDQLHHSIKHPETDGRYDFSELSEIQKAIRKYYLISAQSEKQSMIVDLMQNWKMEIRKLIHDLKNPVQRLMLNVEKLGTNTHTTMALQSINEINSKLKELRLSDGADDISPEEIDLDSFFTRIKSLFYDIELSVINQLEKPFMFDAFGFQRIVSNLIQNAIEASSTAISFSFYQEDDTIICDIRNNGEAVRNPEKLFVPFATTKEKGSGLGLVIILQIVHQHKGHFFLKESDDNETCFSILLTNQSVDR